MTVNLPDEICVFKKRNGVKLLSVGGCHDGIVEQVNRLAVDVRPNVDEQRAALDGGHRDGNTVPEGKNLCKPDLDQRNKLPCEGQDDSTIDRTSCSDGLR